MNDQEIVYSSRGKRLPAPPMLLRLVRLLPWLLRTPLLPKIILKGFSKVNACSVSPGFYAVSMGNLVAERANLNDTVFINYAPVTVGENTRFSGENLILTSTHKTDDFDTVIARPVVIGKNVWITYRCIILGGVSIGDNAIIGAGSVVTKSIPANVIAAGNPCRVIKKL